MKQSFVSKFKYSSKNIIFDNVKNKFLNENDFWKYYHNNYLNFSGSFALIKILKNNIIFCRDPSGSKKIFYGLKKVKNRFALFYSNSFVRLKLSGVHQKNIKSVPRGTFLKLDSKGRIISRKDLLFKDSELKYNVFFKKRILSFLKELKNIHGENCYICISGGLDSALIAFYAKKIFKKPTLVNISFNENLINRKINFYDKDAAAKISRYLKLKLIELKVDLRNILQELNNILYSSQDFRDFNVHCATLNYFIAKKIKESLKQKNYFFITGDFMNEYFADYIEEKINGNIYYKNPDVDLYNLKKFFMRSLDSSDREIGVFNSFSIPLYQPYSILFEYMMNKNFKLKKNGKSKYFYNKNLIPLNLFKLVLKSKRRAQVGDSNGGILSFFIRNNISQDRLKNIFKKNFDLSLKWINNFFLLGMYKH